MIAAREEETMTSTIPAELAGIRPDLLPAHVLADWGRFAAEARQHRDLKARYVALEGQQRDTLDPDEAEELGARLAALRVAMEYHPEPSGHPLHHAVEAGKAAALRLANTAAVPDMVRPRAILSHGGTPEQLAEARAATEQETAATRWRRDREAAQRDGMDDLARLRRMSELLDRGEAIIAHSRDLSLPLNWTLGGEPVSARTTAVAAGAAV
jgi:hypothetical protein